MNGIATDFFLSFRLQCHVSPIKNRSCVFNLWKICFENPYERTGCSRRFSYFPACIPAYFYRPVNAVGSRETIIIRQFIHHPQVYEEGSRHTEYKAQHINGREQETPLYQPECYFYIVLYHIIKY